MRNRKAILLLSALLSAWASPLPAQTWAWARTSIGNGIDYGQTLSVDRNGNVFCGGMFSSDTAQFGSFKLYNSTNVSYGDVFLTKYDPSGNVLWARSAGGSGTEEILSISTDKAGNAYCVGEFESPSITFGSTTLIKSGYFDYDFFFVKYSPTGNVLWAKRAGASSMDEAVSIAADSAGNTYMTGYYNDTLTLGSTVLITKGNYDIFIAKYDAAGNNLWAKSIGSTGSDLSTALALDGKGNLFITGYFDSPSITFGSNTLNCSSASSDFFIAKYDTSGNALWAKSAGGSSFEEGHGISCDAAGNAYVTGDFYGSSFTIGGNTMVKNGTNGGDVFIAKYDAAGNVGWATGAGGNNYDEATSIAVSANSGIYITGHFKSLSMNVGNAILTNAGGGKYDVFIANYDLSGNFLWANRYGGTLDDYGYGVNTDFNGDLHVCGAYWSTSISFGNQTLNNAGGADVFLAKLNSETGMGETSTGQDGILVYPNPSAGLFLITGIEGVTEMTVYNLLGETILHHHPSAGLRVTTSFSIDLSDQPSGIYFLSVEMEKGRVNKRLVIQR